jgi:protein-tyrosine phosphatase
MKNKASVLFVCTANRFRSPIAEAVFRKLLQEKGIEKNWIIGSAGSWTEEGLPPLPSAVWMFEQLGLDLSHHHSKLINQDLISKHDLILVMEKSQKEALQMEYPKMRKKIFILTELSNGPVYDIPDPIQNHEETCFDVAQELIFLITNRFQDICLKVASTRDLLGDI